MAAVHRVAAADPVPELEHVGGVDAEGAHAGGVGRHGDEVLGDGASSPSLLNEPRARHVGVAHRLERRERLGGDDEQRLGGVEILRRLGEGGAVDVGDEAEAQVAVAVGTQRQVGHLGPEVRAADADVDDVADALAGMALPFAGAHALGKVGHAAEHGMHVGHDVAAVDLDHRVARRAQRRVQHGAVLGDVDLVAAEHRVALGAKPALLGELAPAAPSSRA